jgi:hypothetical protein
MDGRDTMAEEIKRLQWIVHKGVTMAHTDFRGLKGKDLTDQMDRNLVQILDRMKGGKRNLLLLSDFTDVPLTGDVYTRSREISEILSPHLVARAMLGITGSRKFVINALNTLVNYPFRMCKSKEEALEWLLERAMIR